ncbi:hypothetical protein EJF18_80104 [Clavispora lusitaniae]|uniref:Uncharacterized protein n=1 Tax=Clavispora lusitaniae TaxID=36911 RepID=A0ACD0WSE0_CLALS|nr:hypothetical protein E0198_005176 [Clavispora lusitaniae]KAF7580513.1 hypothetical protein FOB63_004451 [Clavispora lusitaniae]QFZ30387.1 hypothetical protein EJF14_80104 [Clavispora lusitaniae]QFZ36049.1 hypothetical protein EJF16_80104 [Clavispora lusitaniae]QFZ41733.1 hypothetical protein EJF15_80104 [Clavispora lusitaniae]
MLQALVDFLNAGSVDADGNPIKTFYSYSVEELTQMSLWQRFKLNDWRLEIFTIAFITVFVTLFKAGDIYNRSLVNSFLAGVQKTFEKNFYQFGVGDGKLYIKDNAESYASYATGRENISKVNLVFRLAPRQNIFVWAMETIFSFYTESVPYPHDRVEIVVTPSVDYENFISAVVSKLGMNEYRKFNYYLSLTRTSDCAKLPESFVQMGEVTEFQDKTLTPRLASAFTKSMASFVRFVAFTDQPAEKPEAIRDLLPRRRVVISLKLVTGKEQLAQVSELLDSVFEVVDQIADKTITFRQEASKKVVKNREVEISKIKKAEEAARQLELAEEKAKLKRAEREKARNLSRDEQLKAEKKAQEKKQRRAQKKMKTRM